MTLASDARAIARAGVRAADPAAAVARVLRVAPDGFRVGRARLRVPIGGRVRVVGLGKAAGTMADAAGRILGRDTDGLVATPRGYPGPRSHFAVVFGDHPVPGPASFRAGSALLRFVGDVRPTDRMLFLLSGGGSATAECPLGPLSRRAVARTASVLLGSAAPIGAINAVRRHLSALKGGRLAQATPAEAFATIAISDVVGDPPADVASGPTVGDPSRFRDAIRVVERFHLVRRLPAEVVRFLREGAAGRWPETPKPSDRRLRGAPYVFGATNATALRGAAAEARRRGYLVGIADRPLTGETRPVAERFARELLGARRVGPRPIARLAGGETTVTLGRRPGRGGRNQEFALAAAPVLAGHARACVLSEGTDGIDGPTDAAGGWSDDRSLARARRRGIDVAGALSRHATYDALERLGALVRPGPTGTNVMDLHVGLAGVQSG